MKKFLALLLVLIMSLSMFAACGQTAEPQPDEDVQEEVRLNGMLSQIYYTEEDFGAIVKERGGNCQIVFFDNLNSLLMAVDSGKVERAFQLPDMVARYVVSHNDAFEMRSATATTQYGSDMKFHMGVLKENEELYAELEGAVTEMIADGTFDALAAKYINAYIDTNEDPEPIEIPVIEGADTIKVAVTGDLPPLDFVTADGTPAGYNVAVLAELSNRLGKNIELVTMDAASRLVALTTGNVDILFWVGETKFDDSDDTIFDATDAMSLTSAYYETRSTAVKKAK